VDELEVRELAELHRSCLPDSVVSRLGPGYARSFYRYVTRSPRELVLSERDAEDRVVGGAVLSLDPVTLNRRLLTGTQLVPRMALRGRLLWDLVRDLLAPGSERGDENHLPELLLIFAASSVRGRGIGTGLVARLEAALAERGIAEYRVKTIADPANRALAFYERLGFSRAGEVVAQGRRFQVFRRRVPLGKTA
jgi:GNAT superfamily N-acetyltransferase